MPKVSIIVPVYNVENYLRRCVDSILNQTFSDFELILVDDGSPDNCGVVCDEYEKKDKRIKVIHKENGGLSDARNAGIDIARGEYLGFVDSDDWIHPQMFEILYNGIVENNVKMSVCGYEETDVQKGFEDISEVKYNVKNGLDFFVEKNLIAVVAWNKLYHKSLFEEIRYPIGKIHEDEFITYKLLYKAGNIAYCENQLYCYFINLNGITKSNKNLKRIDQLLAFEERRDYFKKNKLNLYYNWATICLLEFYGIHYKTFKENPQYKDTAKEIRRKMRRLLIKEAKKCKINYRNFSYLYDTAFVDLTRLRQLIKKILKS